MPELQPVLSEGGEVRYLVASSTEFTLLTTPDLCTAHTYLWYSDSARRLRDLVLTFEEFRVEVPQWLDLTPSTTYYTVEDLSEYVRYLAQLLRDKLEGKTVLLSYSGGKDSTAALITLTHLTQYLNLRLKVLYVHIPYLESEENIEFVEEVARRLSIEIEVREPPRKLFRKYLERYGLPYRRNRWCTYFKVRILREFRREVRPDYEVKGDRITECRKRYVRLLKYLERQLYLSGREFRPTYTFTLLDVVRICREHNLVHPDYLRGLPRVSCTYCPYKAVQEFWYSAPVEDPGYIESVLRREYYRWYVDYVEYEDFTTYSLWRYVPKVAKMFTRLRTNAPVTTPHLTLTQVQEYYRSTWVRPLPETKYVDLHQYLTELRRVEEKLRNLLTPLPTPPTLQH